jgi:hypothetical protein
LTVIGPVYFDSVHEPDGGPATRSEVAAGEGLAAIAGALRTAAAAIERSAAIGHRPLICRSIGEFGLEVSVAGG